MKRKCLVMTAALLLMTMSMMGQTYQQLWKQVEEDRQKDLPVTAMQHLQKIVEKAGEERAYGQLLKATLLYAKLQAEVAPDSLPVAVARLEQQEQQAADDVALRAVYDAVLSKVYGYNGQLGDDSGQRSRDYAARAMAHPEVLAGIKADDYMPFVVKGKDSGIFGDDLLSVVGQELEAWQTLNDWYNRTGNRRAACLAALRCADSLAQTDSLLALYGDLPEAGEVAMERYRLMAEADAAQRYAWLQEALKRWGSWKRANELRNELAALVSPTFRAVVERNVSEVNRSQTVRLTDLRHLQQLTMRVYRTQLKGDTDLNPDDADDYRKMKPGLTEVKASAQTLTFTGHEEYDVFEDSIRLDGLPAGVYLLEFSTRPRTEVSRVLYFVSGVRLVMQAQPDNTMRYVVVDATTGQPLGGATLRLSFNRRRKQSGETKTLTCNQQGEVTCHYENRLPPTVFAYTKTDSYCPELNGYGRYSYYERQYGNEHVSLFTDRSIYRPGQTVHVAAVVWKEQSAIDNVAVADRSVKVELRDANYKLVAEQTVMTDRYGKCATVFTLPTGLLNGRFTIRANGGSTSIRVEEYKRPTFQVEFPEYKQPYRNGDTVRATAKAVTYAGVPVQGAKVRYAVKRQVAWWWLSYSRYWEVGYIGNVLGKEVVKEGETTTGDDGTFEVEMPMCLPEDGADSRPMFYHFVVEADVTDVGGETRSGSMTLPLGTKPTALTCDLPQKIRADQLPEVTFSRRNAAGKEIEGTVRYRIDNGQWQACTANSQKPIANGQKLSSGEHRLEAVCETDSIDMKFVVFGLDDKRPAVKTSDWFYVSHQQFPNDGAAVTLQVGSSDPDLHIVYGIYAGERVVESGILEKNAELLNRKFTYQEEYGNGLLITYAWVKDGQCHTHQAFIRRPMPDKQLKMTWETFRDRLTPGQQEEWRIKILNPDGTPADASMMAVLYDKSLDQIVKHSWSFSPSTWLSQPSTGWLWRSWVELDIFGRQQYEPLSVPALSFSHFDESVYPQYRMVLYESMRIRGTRMSKSMVAATAVAQEDESKVYDAVESTAGNGVMEEVTSDKGEVTSDKGEVQLRENLDETAFCYPMLETDKDGGVTMRFTLPESLTTWRFMGVSNTRDMLYGSIDGEAVAKKDVMVLPNVPRFVRLGDEAQLSARIFNTSDHEADGLARMQLIDPETNQVVCETVQSFTVEAGQTGSVAFPLLTSQNLKNSESQNLSLFICKVTVIGDGFSDGEQHYLPVLPDCEYVTKTVPYTQHEPGIKTIDLTKLFPVGTTRQKLTIEYTNNPAWLMVQSLPTLGQPWEHSAIDQAASYYSNMLAKTLLAQSPQVKTVFEQWKRESGAEQTLQSQLQKNQELKDLVLAETSWVCAADREAEQKQRLSDFFDENGINNRLATAVEKLRKLQNADGSFSWYPGMGGSISITVAVEEMLVRLSKMAGEQRDTKQMQTKAFDYIGKEMVELVAELKKQEKKGRKPSFPSFTALRWLYLCAVDGRQLSASVKSANDYLIALLKKDIKNQTIYEKALSAIILSKRGENQKAAEYVRSLKEYTVFTEEMGRYYDTRKATYSWYDYKIPTEVAAIEAIQSVTPQDRQTVDEMRRWLLQEKRTQAWDTPVNSVNAIYAFLNPISPIGPMGLMGPISLTTLAIDGETVNTSAATAGLGYVKTAVNNPQGKTFTATKTSEGTSWGAVYAQFFQKTSEVEASQSGITVKRELLTANGQKLTAPLKVGDRIRVRITVETTRDLDFVQVVDRRAACMEPVRQLSGYQNGAYITPKDNATHYYYGGLAKGRHVIETEYYIDRAGQYETGTCTVGCAYAPEYRATAPAMTFNVK